MGETPTCDEAQGREVRPSFPRQWGNRTYRRDRARQRAAVCIKVQIIHRFMQIDIVCRLCRCRQHSTLTCISCSGNKHGADLSINAPRYPGDLSISNRNGANRSLLRFMRLHLSHWVLMMRTLKSLRGRIVPNLTPVSTMLQTDPGTVGDQG